MLGRIIQNIVRWVELLYLLGLLAYKEILMMCFIIRTNYEIFGLLRFFGIEKSENFRFNVVVYVVSLNGEN